MKLKIFLSIVFITAIVGFLGLSKVNASIINIFPQSWLTACAEDPQGCVVSFSAYQSIHWATCPRVGQVVDGIIVYSPNTSTIIYQLPDANFNYEISTLSTGNNAVFVWATGSKSIGWVSTVCVNPSTLTPSPTIIPTVTPTLTQEITPTSTPTPIVTIEPSVSPTPTPTIEITPTETPSITPEVTPTEVLTVTPTPSAPEITPAPVEAVSIVTNSGNGGNPPTFAGSTTNASTCGSTDTTLLPANPFVIRNGTDATVDFFLTQGDSANIYWSVVGQPLWGNSSALTNPNGILSNSDNFVSYVIHALDANQKYVFGIQQKYGCGGGQIIEPSIIPNL